MKAILFTVIFMQVTVVNAQTNVGGPIFSDVTWDLSGSPYNLTSDVQIATGVTLTINPGVIVNFTDANMIYIQEGAIVANGTSADTIYFNSTNTLAESSAQFIVFNTSNLALSQLSFCSFDIALSAILIESSCYGNLSMDNNFFNQSGVKSLGQNINLQIDHSYFYNADIVQSKQDTICINHCEFNQVNFSFNMEDHFQNDIDSWLSIKNSTMYSIGLYNFDYNAYSPVSTIFESCIINGAYDDIFNSGGEIIFRDSEVLNFSFSNHTRYHLVKYQNCYIENNNSIDLELQGYGAQKDTLYIENSDVVDSDLDYRDFFGNALFYLKNSRFYNTRIQNTTTHGSIIDHCIFVNYTEKLNALKNSTISNSAFIGQYNVPTGKGMTTISGSISESLIQGFNIGIDANNATTVSFTNFINNTSYNIYNNSSSDFYCQNNYWSEMDSVSIKSKVFDYYDDITKGKIIITPFLILLNNDAPISPPKNLIGIEHPTGVLYSWEANSESDISGYRIHYGGINRLDFNQSVDIGNVTSFFLDGATINDTIAITAYDLLFDGNVDMIEGHESWYSVFSEPCNNDSVTDVITACNSYTWIDGNTYTSSNNTATFNIVGGAANGCDSLVTLDLTILNSATGTDTRTECNSYSWIDGNTYTSSNNTASFNIVGGAANGCDSLVTLDLTILNSATGIDTKTACNSYTWIDGNTYTYSNNIATFNIVGGAANGCDSLVTLDLTINSVSDISTSLSGVNITSNNSGATYQWLDCDNGYATITNATSQTFVATASGNYAVELTENGCVDTTVCVAITSVGIVENSFGDALMVYPNPTNGNFSINLGGVYETSIVSITDINGKLIDSKTITQSQTLDLSLEEPNGVYIVSIQAGDKNAVIRLVKQ